MKYKSIKVLTVISLVVFSSIGCSSNSTTTEKKTSEQIKEELLNFTPDFKTDFTEMEKEVLSNIKDFSQEEKNQVMENYLNAAFSTVEDLNNKLSVVGYELEYVLEEFNVDVLKPETYSNIPQRHYTVKGFLEELNQEGFILRFDNVSKMYFVELNLKDIIDKFKDHLTSSLKSYLEFNNYEMTSEEQIVDTEGNINIKEIVNRLNKTYEGYEIDKKDNYSFPEKWSSSMEYYYMTLFGFNHDYFVGDDDSSKYSDEYIKEIEELSKGTDKASEVIKKALEIINKNEKDIEKSIAEIFEIVKQEIYPEEVEEAIKKKYPQTEEVVPETSTDSTATTEDTTETTNNNESKEEQKESTEEKE